MKRNEVSDESLLAAIEAITVNTGKRIEKHGRGAFVSNHEALGVVVEEYHELVGAVTQNDPVDVASELTDVAVSCVFALASMIEKEKQLKIVAENTEKELKNLQLELEV